MTNSTIRSPIGIFGSISETASSSSMYSGCDTDFDVSLACGSNGDGFRGVDVETVRVGSCDCSKIYE